MWQSACGFHEKCVCKHPCVWGGRVATHMQERKCQMFHFLCVWVRLCSWGETQCRLADSTEVCNAPQCTWSTGMFCLLPKSFAYNLSNKHSSPTHHMSHFCEGPPATYRTTSIPHTVWVPHWPPRLMKNPQIPPHPCCTPSRIEKASTSPSSSFFVFTTLPPSSVALPLRCGWLLWSGPAL